MGSSPTPGLHLLPRFVTACRDAAVRASVVDVEGAAMDLLRRWSEPHRHYHDTEHLGEVLDRLDELGDPDACTRLAAWFHDAVYAGRPHEDERASAVLASRELKALGAPAPVPERVRDLVLVTADHDPPDGDTGAAQLCDADLAVLAAPRQRYARYADAVRREYAHLDPQDFRRGRATVLRRLLSGPVYRTELGRARWEDAARANVTAELELLEGPVDNSV